VFQFYVAGGFKQNRSGILVNQESSISVRSGFLVSLWSEKSQEQQKSQEKPEHIHTKRL